MGWGTLRSKDSNAQTRRRARHAYLYFDGTYGFFPQLFLAFGTGLLSTELGHKLILTTEVFETKMFGTSFIVALFIVLIWQSVVSIRDIPRLLFVANGYSKRVRYFWQRSQPNDPPWGKLFLANFLGGSPLAFCVGLLIGGVSVSLAWLLFWLRSLVI
jgi:hypothetical protein